MLMCMAEVWAFAEFIVPGWGGKAEGAGPNPNAPDAESAPDPSCGALAPIRNDLPEDMCDPGPETPSSQAVLQALESIRWPRTTSRPNVSEEPIEAMCFGMS